MLLTKKEIVKAATESCELFARTQKRFFEKRSGYQGWENWLTVEITRRLDDGKVIPFHQYGSGRVKMDIYIENTVPIAVEIKVNFIIQSEVARSMRDGGNRKLPAGVFADKEKINRLGSKVEKLIFVATCFDTKESLNKYKKLVRRDIEQRFKLFKQHQWYDCSAGDGHNLLLALSSIPGLPKYR